MSPSVTAAAFAGWLGLMQANYINTSCTLWYIYHPTRAYVCSAVQGKRALFGGGKRGDERFRSAAKGDQFAYKKELPPKYRHRFNKHVCHLIHHKSFRQDP